MKKFSWLQIGIFIACTVGVVLAVLLFSGKIQGRNSGETKVTGNLVLWGTLPALQVRSVITDIAQVYKEVRVDYQQKDPEKFQSDFTNALASGTGPDLVILDSSHIIQNSDRLLTIPYASLPRETFQSTFIDQAALFTNDKGVLALPMFTDPLVMYYNRDLLTSSFVSQPPVTWDDVVALAKQVTKRDDAGNITTSAVALGTFDNITHAKELISTLIFQLKGSLIGRDPETGKYVSLFGSGGGQRTEPPSAVALRFYTDFTKTTTSDHYTWNGALPNDKAQFIAGNLALYFGTASEVAGIRKKNPNLNFGVTMMPQSAVQNTKVTYGNLFAVGVVKMTKQMNAALAIANQLAQKSSIDAYLALDASLAPARRDALAQSFADDPLKTVVYRSAIISKSLLDPDPAKTTDFFRRLVNQLNAGTLSPEAVPGTGGALLQDILDEVQQ
jgi:ABC-type glycerol-3-phosphate transport system substrate-binding protein